MGMVASDRSDADVLKAPVINENRAEGIHTRWNLDRYET
jgi:hypothetical protein